MPPKASRSGAGHDDSKSETPTHKEKNGHGPGSHHSSAKLRRVASSAGTTLKDVTSAAALLAAGSNHPPAAPAPVVNPSLQWATFDREFLHNYRRAYSLTTPTAYSSDYHSWVLNQPGSVGLHSPTVKRKKEARRQSKGSLTNTVRKHFNSLGVQENDAIVDFLHRVRTDGSSRSPRIKKQEQSAVEAEK